MSFGFPLVVFLEADLKAQLGWQDAAAALGSNAMHGI